MLCTVVWDAYTTEDRKAVWHALRTLTPPNGRDWSPKGVYAYWDPAERQLLYVGLASDLPLRFACHNGLVPHTGGNKERDIDEWFDGHRTLGFTVVLQSAAAQIMEVVSALSPALGVPSSEIIAVAEGQLIELHRLEFGRRPPWNRVGGAVMGQGWAKPTERSMIRLLAAADCNLFVARRTLRTLASDEQAMRFEATIHAARMRTLIQSHDVGRAVGEQAGSVELISRLLMLRSGHLVDDLTASDESIQVWLRKLADGSAQAEEIQELATMAQGLDQETMLEEDQQALMFTGAVVNDAAFIESTAVFNEVLESGYLRDEPLF